MSKSKLRTFIESHIENLSESKIHNLFYDAIIKDMFDDCLDLFDEISAQIPEIKNLPYSVKFDATLMPEYLRIEHFAVWFKKFNELLCKFNFENSKSSKFDFTKSGITIKFSNEEKRKHYSGEFSIDEVKEIIRNKWRRHREIEDILDRITDFDDFNNLIRELCETIHRIYPNRDCCNPEELFLLLRNMSFDADILGEYDTKEKSIILYTPNIEKAAIKHKNNNVRECEKVFIHELFHAYHYFDDKDELVYRHDYTLEVVVESLASAFEWFYCVENKINGESDLRKSWNNHSVLYYPYSAASNLLAFKLSTTIDFKKFEEVFNASIKDMDNALRKLTPLDFYDIKNLIHVRRKDCDILDLRNAFDELMKQDLIGEIARREIPSIIRKNRLLIPMLMDLNYSTINFNATQYPILSTSPMLDSSGRKRSYSEPVHVIGKKKFYMSAQWDKEQLELLLDWIWENRK